MISGRLQRSRTSKPAQVAANRGGDPVERLSDIRVFQKGGVKYIIVSPAELFYRERSHTRIYCTGTKKLQRVVSVNFSPLRQKLLYGLFHFGRITPSDRLEELRETSFIPCKIEPEFPN